MTATSSSWIRDEPPTTAGRYEVSPFQTVEMVSEATWDGKVWRYLSSGRECYIQKLAWRHQQQELAA
ncbi:hypothetical protein ACFQUU_08630 [Herbaspirillum sp. GCM10030257]|uniref:hypothetical protein n=1 Tax=Herbaspirillum sp. GCM10030257 TaxID=3273393 RepID=UPI00361B9F92